MMTGSRRILDCFLADIVLDFGIQTVVPKLLRHIFLIISFYFNVEKNVYLRQVSSSAHVLNDGLAEA